MHPRAIETRYKGYRFRSRLEARWAVFFDHLGLRWDYEPEGFELPSGRYLPDFFIHWEGPKSERLQQFPTVGYWVEIKGAPPSAAELQRLSELATATKHNAYLLAHGPAHVRAWACWAGRPAVEVVGLGLAWLAFVQCCPREAVGLREVEAAVAAAMGARFEHGEKGGAR